MYAEKGLGLILIDSQTVSSPTHISQPTDSAVAAAQFISSSIPLKFLQRFIYDVSNFHFLIYHSSPAVLLKLLSSRPPATAMESDLMVSPLSCITSPLSELLPTDYSRLSYDTFPFFCLYHCTAPDFLLPH